MKKNIIIIGFLLTLLLLVSIIFISRWQIAQLVIYEQNQEYTFNVIQGLDRLLKIVRDVRSDQRSYTSSMNENYHILFHKSLKEADLELESLMRLASGHPWLEKRLAVINPLVKQKLSEFAEQLELGSGQGPQTVANGDRPKGVMAEIRKQVAIAKDEAVSLMRELTAKEEAEFRKMEHVLIVNSIISFALITAVLLLLRKDLAMRIRSEQELIRHRDQLDELVKARTLELENERKRSEQMLHNLNDHENMIQEQERLSLSREVHDGIGQNLTALKLDLSWMEHKLIPGNSELNERMREMRKTLDQLIVKAQIITAELRPPLLDNLGMAAAIEWQVNEFRRRSGIACNLMQDERIESSDQRTATTIIRILQEALTNVIRHARATEASISLCERGNQLILEISDNGCGITIKEIDSPTAYGIMGMRERALLCQGELTIKGNPEHGTTLCLKVPRPAIKEVS